MRLIVFLPWFSCGKTEIILSHRRAFFFFLFSFFFFSQSGTTSTGWPTFIFSQVTCGLTYIYTYIHTCTSITYNCETVTSCSHFHRNRKQLHLLLCGKGIRQFPRIPRPVPVKSKTLLRPLLIYSAFTPASLTKQDAKQKVKKQIWSYVYYCMNSRDPVISSTVKSNFPK